MAQSIYEFLTNGAFAGISDSKFSGIKGSFQNIENLEIRKDPKTISLQKALKKDSGGIVVDLVNCALTVSSTGDIVAFGNQGNIYIKSLGGTWQKVYTFSGNAAIIGCVEYNSYIYFATLDKLHRTDITSITSAVSTGTLVPTDLNRKTLTGLSYSNGLNTLYTTDTSTKLKVGEKIYVKQNYALTDVGVANGTTAPTKAYLQEAPKTTAIAFNSQRLYTTAEATPVDLTVTPTWTERRPLGDVNINRTASAVSTDGLKMYVSSDNSNIRKSTDGGVNWTEIPKMSTRVLSDSINSGSPFTATTNSKGVEFTLNGTLSYKLKTVSKNSGSTATRCRLLNAAGVLIENGTVSGNDATFTSTLSPSTTYRVERDNSGNSYTPTAISWSSTPHVLTYITSAAGSTNGASDGNNYGNVNSITLENIYDQFDNLSCSGDGTKVIASKKNGRIFISTDSGSTWSESIPTGTASVTDATGVTYNNTYSKTVKSGFKIYSNYAQQLTSFKVDSQCTATTGYLYSATIGGEIGTLLATAPITSQIATFNYTLVGSTSYFIVVDSGGSSYTTAEQGTSPYPINKTNINYTGGYDNGNTLGSYFNIENVITTAGGNLDRRISKVSQDGSTYLAGAYGGRLYTSTNGVSWTERQPAGASNQNRTDGFINYDGTKLLSNNGNNLYKSTDSGANWGDLNSVFTPSASMTMVAANNDLSLIAVRSTEAISYSIDYGATKADYIFPAGSTVLDIQYDFNGQVLTVTTAKRVYKSLDGGATFTEWQPAGNTDKTWNGIVLSAGAIPIETVSVSASKATFSTNIVSGKYYNILFDKEGSSRDPKYKAVPFPVTKTDLNYLFGMKPYRDTNAWVITSIGTSVVNAITHPMITSNGTMYLGDGNYLATVDLYGTYTADKLTLPELDKIYDISYNNSYLRLYCDQGTNRDTGIAYFWDGIQDAPDQKQSLPGKFQCATIRDNVDYAIMGFEPVLYYYPYQRQPLKRINNLSTGIYGMINYKNYLLFGCKGGVYSRGNYNKDYPEVLNIEYKTSNLNDTDEIGAVWNANGDLYVSWKNGSTYGIDILSTTDYATIGSITGRIYYGEQMRHNKNIVEVYLTHKPLILGEEIRIYTKRNMTGSRTLQATFNSTNGNVEHNKINFPLNFNELEFKLELIGPGTSTPEVYECLVRVEEQQS